MKKRIRPFALLLAFLLSGCGEAADPVPSPQESHSSLPPTASPSPSPTEQLTLPLETPSLTPFPSPLPGEEPIVWEDEFFGLCVVTGLMREHISPQEATAIPVYPSQIEPIKILTISAWGSGLVAGVDESGTSYVCDLDNLEGNIETLCDLRYFPNLQKLEIVTTTATSLAPIAALTGLEELYIGGQLVNREGGIENIGGFTDITPLTKLKNLKKIGIYSPTVTDISVIADMPQLTEVFLDVAPHTDITPLYGLNRLQSLLLVNSTLDSLDFLQGYPDLELLSLHNCTIFHPPTVPLGLTKLTECYLFDTPLDSIAFLSDAKELITITANNCNIPDESALYNLPKLKLSEININEWT